jgi:hypothetical protein
MKYRPTEATKNRRAHPFAVTTMVAGARGNKAPNQRIEIGCRAAARGALALIELPRPVARGLCDCGSARWFPPQSKSHDGSSIGGTVRPRAFAGLEIDHKLELGQPHDGQVSGILPFQNRAA